MRMLIRQKTYRATNCPPARQPISSEASSNHTKANCCSSASGVRPAARAEKALKQIQALGGEKLPVCIAKTQYSLSDDPTLLGAPKNFEITVKNLTLSNGAGFVVVYTGDIMTMPGLPKVPSAEKIDVTEEGKINGLF